MKKRMARIRDLNWSEVLREAVERRLDLEERLRAPIDRRRALDAARRMDEFRAHHPPLGSNRLPNHTGNASAWTTGLDPPSKPALTAAIRTPYRKGLPSPTRATSPWRIESMASCIPQTKRCSGRPAPAGSTFDRWAYRDETPMFLLAHLGIGLGLAWLLAWKSPARFDYRLVLFGSILPDLIDQPP